MTDQCSAGDDGHRGVSPAGSSFGIWSDGFFMNDDGCVVQTYQVNVGGPDSDSTLVSWPRYRPELVKLCKQEHLVHDCRTVQLSRPTAYRDEGETLMSDPEEARASRKWTTEPLVNDADKLAAARLLDAEANRGSELVGSTLTVTTNEVKDRRSRTERIDRGSCCWLFCTALTPTTKADWESLCAAQNPEHDHYWALGRPREIARALATMFARQVVPHESSVDLTHPKGTDAATRHRGQTVFHGPVAYVDDPYDWVAESGSSMEHLLRPLFAKRRAYEPQREYRFVVWDEEARDGEHTILQASPALLRTTTAHDSGPVPVTRPLTTSHAPPVSPSPVVVDSTELPVTDPLTESFFDLVNDPHIQHVVSNAPADNPPSDLDEKTAVYAAVETLRQIVGKTGNTVNAAAAAWHAEPYIRRLCAAFLDPIHSIRITDDDFVVIKLSYPESSDATGRIAIGPRGIARIRTSTANKVTDSTRGKDPIEGWPILDDFEQTLENNGLPRAARHNSSPPQRSVESD